MGPPWIASAEYKRGLLPLRLLSYSYLPLSCAHFAWLSGGLAATCISLSSYNGRCSYREALLLNLLSFEIIHVWSLCLLLFLRVFVRLAVLSFKGRDQGESSQSGRDLWCSQSQSLKDHQAPTMGVPSPSHRGPKLPMVESSVRRFRDFSAPEPRGR